MMQRTTVAERCLLNQYEDHAFTAQGSEEMGRGYERAADSKLETDRDERDSFGDCSEGRGNERMVESAGRFVRTAGKQRLGRPGLSLVWREIADTDRDAVVPPSTSSQQAPEEVRERWEMGSRHRWWQRLFGE